MASWGKLALTPWKINNFVDPLKPRSLAYYDCDSKLMLLVKYNNRARIHWGGYRIEEKSVRLKLNDEHKGLNIFSEGASIFTRNLQKIQRKYLVKAQVKLSQHYVEYWVGFYGEKTKILQKGVSPNLLADT